MFCFGSGTYDFITDKTGKKKERNGRKAPEGRHDEWEKLYEQKDLRVWRKPVNSNGLYEYKGISVHFGTSQVCFQSSLFVSPQTLQFEHSIYFTKINVARKPKRNQYGLYYLGSPVTISYFLV